MSSSIDSSYEASSSISEWDYIISDYLFSTTTSGEMSSRIGFSIWMVWFDMLFLKDAVLTTSSSRWCELGLWSDN